MRNKIDVSLKDTAELRKLILENPESPLVVFASEYSNSGEHGYEFCKVSDVSIQELAMVGDMYVEKCDYEDELYCHLDISSEYENMSKKELGEMIDKMVKETEFTKAIVIKVG